MKKKVQQSERNALSVRTSQLAKPFSIPALVVPQTQSVAIDLIAPKYQAERITAFRETEERVRKEKERARRQEERRARAEARKRVRFNHD